MNHMWPHRILDNVNRYLDHDSEKTVSLCFGEKIQSNHWHYDTPSIQKDSDDMEQVAENTSFHY